MKTKTIERFAVIHKDKSAIIGFRVGELLYGSIFKTREEAEIACTLPHHRIAIVKIQVPIFTEQHVPKIRHRLRTPALSAARQNLLRSLLAARPQGPSQETSRHK